MLWHQKNHKSASDTTSMTYIHIFLYTHNTDLDLCMEWWWETWMDLTRIGPILLESYPQPTDCVRRRGLYTESHHGLWLACPASIYPNCVQSGPRFAWPARRVAGWHVSLVYDEALFNVCSCMKFDNQTKRKKTQLSVYLWHYSQNTTLKFVIEICELVWRIFHWHDQI